MFKIMVHNDGQSLLPMIVGGWHTKKSRNCLSSSQKLCRLVQVWFGNLSKAEQTHLANLANTAGLTEGADCPHVALVPGAELGRVVVGGGVQGDTWVHGGLQMVALTEQTERREEGRECDNKHSRDFWTKPIIRGDSWLQMTQDLAFLLTASAWCTSHCIVSVKRQINLCCAETSNQFLEMWEMQIRS